MIVMVIFYQQQSEMTLYSVVMIATLFSVYNLEIFKTISDWSARIHSGTVEMQPKLLRLWGLKKIPKRYRITKLTLMKSQHFNQSIPNTRIGFTCGHLFHISKNRFVELVLMNIGLVSLIYKKLILGKN
ncbi:hypothetical protein QR98_0004130 [Sarcoptes scabiei]|uniref:Uncharacterized protein n=1 Tax=Sarcoptes scabiei TaxID=52283 RepID=A0A131ZTC3_SARSC|nr:hypothetical protein QR98_0004130 [Sarcoptes scabiei]